MSGMRISNISRFLLFLLPLFMLAINYVSACTQQNKVQFLCNSPKLFLEVKPSFTNILINLEH